ncbi:MAG: (2Fe-2S)-binding protein [Oligoflexia bacterium]|nr:(2Fe-2S)-binding protein [Oligoflexia bacterium]
MLNGEKIEVWANAHKTLLELLREDLGIKSPKCGCDLGDCGACTVFLDGKSVRSCLILVPEVNGCDVVTLEGIMRPNLTKLQQFFLDHNSFQCGFCAPGMVLSATELLQKNPTPTLEEIKEGLSGNLCRCTGYTPIINAVADAVATTVATTINE